MIRLVKYELFKTWRSSFFLISFSLLIVVNLFLLWFSNVHTPGNISPSAYRTLAISMRGKDMNELDAFLYAELSRTEALTHIDYTLREEAVKNGKFNEVLRDKYALDFKSYLTLYQEMDFLKYGNSLTQEYAFLNAIVLEFSQVSDYEGFLNELEERAERLLTISVFADSSRGFEKENIIVTSNAFRGMRDISIHYFPQKGIVTALNFELTDVISVLAMLLIATVSVRLERDGGLLGLVRANPAGRFKTATAKIFSFSISLGIVLFCLYGFNLVYCDCLYGLGPLNRTIQSVPLLMRSTLRLTVGQYIVLFLLTKWSAALICGTWVLFAMLSAKRLLSGFLSSLFLILINLLIRTIIPATSNFNVLKYANLVSLLRTNELLGRYHNLYWFDRPVPLVVVESVAALFFFILFLVSFLYVFSKAYFTPASRSIKMMLLNKNRATNYVTVTRTEWYKLLILQGGIVVFALFLGIQAYTALKTENYINADEIYYRNYIKPIEGIWTEDKYKWMIEQQKEFTPIHQLKSYLDSGTITIDEYQFKIRPYTSLLRKMDIYYRIAEKVNYLNEKPRKQLVYESGWLMLLDYDDNQDLGNALSISIFCALCFSSFFPIEYQTGMVKVISSTPLGREYTVKKKMQITMIICAALSCLCLFSRFWYVLRDYGLGAWTAPIYSIEQYSNAPEIPLFLIVFIMFALRFLSIYFMSCIILVLGQRTKNTFATLFISLSVFSLPLFLSMVGLQNAKWISLYLPFHFCNLLIEKGGIALLISSSFIYSVGSLCCFYYLDDYFGRN